MDRRPDVKDYPDHIVKYLRQVPEGELAAVLKRQGEALADRLATLTEEQSLYRYAPGKWSIKQLLGHLTDAERVFAYRLLRAARNDRTPLPGFDENEFVDNAFFDGQAFAALLAQFQAVRSANNLLIGSLTEEEWDCIAVVNGYEGTALSWACVIAGHAEHHIRVLEERYFPALDGTQV